MEKVPMTLDGYNSLETELKRLKTVERPDVIKAIAVAREHGDLSENAEYHAAKERQAFIEGRVNELEEKVKFGAKVTLADEDPDEEITYQIVGEHEAEIKGGRLSVSSPLGRALISKTVGDSVEVTTPKGAKSYEVIDVRFK